MNPNQQQQQHDKSLHPSSAIINSESSYHTSPIEPANCFNSIYQTMHNFLLLLSHMLLCLFELFRFVCFSLLLTVDAFTDCESQRQSLTVVPCTHIYICDHSASYSIELTLHPLRHAATANNSHGR